MAKNKHYVAEGLLKKNYEVMDERTQRVARHITERIHISRNTQREFEESVTVGQKAADAVAKFGGSWAFIILFAITLTCWVILNTFVLASYHRAFDPYPYILLNLFLSMLASIQAPIILMSQNRQAEIDRKNAEHDYEVNLKAELEILLLHEKMDALREQQWDELIALQKQQLELLNKLGSSLNK